VTGLSVTALALTDKVLLSLTRSVANGKLEPCEYSTQYDVSRSVSHEAIVLVYHST
jgi:hypothetical protein